MHLARYYVLPLLRLAITRWSHSRLRPPSRRALPSSPQRETTLPRKENRFSSPRIAHPTYQISECQNRLSSQALPWLCMPSYLPFFRHAPLHRNMLSQAVPYFRHCAISLRRRYHQRIALFEKKLRPLRGLPQHSFDFRPRIRSVRRCAECGIIHRWRMHYARLFAFRSTLVKRLLQRS